MRKSTTALALLALLTLTGCATTTPDASPSTADPASDAPAFQVAPGTSITLDHPDLWVRPGAPYVASVALIDGDTDNPILPITERTDDGTILTITDDVTPGTYEVTGSLGSYVAWSYVVTVKEAF